MGVIHHDSDIDRVGDRLVETKHIVLGRIVVHGRRYLDSDGSEVLGDFRVLYGAQGIFVVRAAAEYRHLALGRLHHGSQ